MSVYDTVIISDPLLAVINKELRKGYAELKNEFQTHDLIGAMHCFTTTDRLSLENEMLTVKDAVFKCGQLELVDRVPKMNNLWIKLKDGKIWLIGANRNGEDKPFRIIETPKIDWPIVYDEHNPRFQQMFDKLVGGNDGQ